jgi:hypothetical protein
MKKHILLFTFITFFFSCNKDDCRKVLNCDDEYRYVLVVLEAMAEKIEEISYSEAVLVENGERIYSHQQNGSFNPFDEHVLVVLGDSAKNKLSQSGSEIIWRVYDFNEELLAEKSFIIGHDCCHIEKLEGIDVLKL